MRPLDGRRVLALLECRPSDEAVRARAVEVVAATGGYLTLVVVVPTPALWLNAGPYCLPRVSREELREHASAVLAREAALVPPDIPLLTAVEEGKAAAVVARRVATAAHDLVVVRSRRLRWTLPARRTPVPMVAVAA